MTDIGTDRWPGMVGEPLYVCDNNGQAVVVRRFADGSLIFSPPIPVREANGVFFVRRGGCGLEKASPEMIEVDNFRDALLGRNGRRLKDYTKRDKRLDAMLAKKPLTAEQVDRYVDRYRKRRIALNAESVARTAALDSVKAAQRMSWEEAISKGIVERRLMRKMWIATQDSRTRDEHAALNGEVVGFDEAFSNGEVTAGETAFNCRCVMRYFQAREE